MLLFGCVRKACAAVSEVKLSQTCLCGVDAVVPLGGRGSAVSEAAARAGLTRGHQRMPKPPWILGPSEGGDSGAV